MQNHQRIGPSRCSCQSNQSGARRQKRLSSIADTASRYEQIKRINALQNYIAQQTDRLTEFDESLVRRWVKQINICDDRITVELKSGVSIDVDA